MDNLSQQQYESILKYMQSTNQDNFQQACKIMQECNYDLQTAREKKRNQNLMENNNTGRNINREQYREILEEQQDQQINKMRKYLLHRVNTRKRTNKFTKLTKCIKNICIRATQTFIPDMINRKIIKSYFYRIYQDSAVIQLKNRSLRVAIEQCRNNRKKLMVIVSERAKNHCIQEFLKKKNILLKIIEEYEIVGLTDTELKDQFRQLFANPSQNQNSNQNLDTSSSSNPFQTKIPQPNPPSILIFRQRHTEDLELIHTFHKQSQILGINEQILIQLKQKIKQNSQKQSALLRKITQRLFQENFGVLQQQQNKRLIINRRVGNIMINNHQEHEHQHQGDHDGVQHDQIDNVQANFIKNRRESKLIAQQNLQYLEMQRKKKQKQQQQRIKQQKIQQFLSQRNCRKLSMPDQPSDQNDGIIKIIFRCPNGQNITRKFLLNQKCELLFNWVQLNDDIQFQNQQSSSILTLTDNGNKNSITNSGISSNNSTNGSSSKIIHKDRQFDLLFSYPPQSLRERKELLLRDVFQGENQVKILIRQE